MSAELERFKRHAKNRSWGPAYKELNGLTMTEMLTGLDQIGPSSVDDLDAQAPLFAGSYNMPRMQYAINAIQTRKLPTKAPTSVYDSQVKEAKKYLASNQKKAIKQKRLKITMFWTKKAKSESISSKLIDKAQQLLEANGNEYILDVAPMRGILPTDKDHWEGDSDSSCKDNEEFKELYALVKKSKLYSVGRLPVIFYRSLQTLGPHGEPNDPIQHGCGCYMHDGKAMVLINVRKQAADNVTLLHEIGHAAKLKHDGNPEENFMYGFPDKDTKRTAINPVQREKLARCYFCA